jgi:dUTP pyrophosphatase
MSLIHLQRHLKLITQIAMPQVVVVDKLEESVRGAGGFGSTGGFGAGATQGP